MKEFVALIKSFGYAACGIGSAIKTERNIRIHITAVYYVTLFGIFFGLTPTEWAIVCICFGLVIGAELINTSIESAVNLFCGKKKNEAAKKAKDCAAGAVLVTAVIALCAAVAIFGTKGEFTNTVKQICTTLPGALFVYIPIIPAIIFIFAKKEK